MAPRHRSLQAAQVMPRPETDRHFSGKQLFPHDITNTAPYPTPLTVYTAHRLNFQYDPTADRQPGTFPETSM